MQRARVCWCSRTLLYSVQCCRGISSVTCASAWRTRVSTAVVSSQTQRRDASTYTAGTPQQRAAVVDEDGGDKGGVCTTLATTTTTTTVDTTNDADATPWPEPTLADLDRSIPQVDCVFIASLVRHRRMRRDDFLRAKIEVKAKVQQLTRQRATSVLDGATLHHVGKLGTASTVRVAETAALTISADSSSSDSAAGGDVSASDANAPVLASDEVLQDLSADERDVLSGARPEYDDGFVLLDCRTVNEVTSWGIIEGAKVLPAHELFDAFHACPADFLRDCGFAKPTPEQMIICYCQYGPRSLMAAQILSWMGYLNVLHFRDGYYEWGKQYNLLLRRWMEHDKASGNELRRLAAFQAALELQRAIAPEFNALPMQEAAKYRLDTTRSRGTLRVGEGLRGEAYAALERLTRDSVAALPSAATAAAPASLLLPASHERAVGTTASGNNNAAATADDTATSSTTHASPLTEFLQHATGYKMP